MDGFINVLKPVGMTSHDVVAWLRRLLNYRKIGHAGTLDPNAAGVLPIALGKGTRLLEYLLNNTKRYRCEIILGIETTTQDLDGEIVARKTVTKEQLEQFPAILGEFRGEIEQIPPMVSAVRVQGKRLYELARQGVSVERTPRRVVISELQLLETCFDRPPYTALFDVECSKGTYIRTLCYDVGIRLGCGASLSWLLRTKSAGFRLSDAWTLEKIKANWEAGKRDFLHSLTGVLSFPVVLVNEEQEQSVRQGKQIPLVETDHDLAEPDVKQLIQIVDAKGLVAIAELLWLKQQFFLQPRKVLR
jgi:tRNA pseudouridine55 synthase